MSKAHILFCDDDIRLTQLLPQLLIQHGFYATAVNSAADARQVLQWYRVDVLLLDVMMPNESGLELLQDLRHQNYTLPVLMLSAMAERSDRIKGLATGADDYIVKPFDPEELLLRIEAILRRTTPQSVVVDTTSVGAFLYDAQRQLLQHRHLGEEISLTTNESKIINALLGRDIVSREDLSEILGIQTTDSRAVDTHIARLRKKIGDDAASPRYLITVRGQGYRLTPYTQD